MQETCPICYTPQFKTLHLPMDKKWFDMILSGEKKEEYRLYKPYWMSRVENWTKERRKLPDDVGSWFDPPDVLLQIRFFNGYQENAPWFTAMCDRFETRSKSLHPEWGESEYDGKDHFVFHVGPIVARGKC